MNNIESLVSDFTAHLAVLIEQQTLDRARAAVGAALGGSNGHRAGAAAGSAAVGRRPRRKAPIQLCPVPGCKNRAAPVFGMVCAKHKDLPKAKIKKYRQARRARKAA